MLVYHYYAKESGTGERTGNGLDNFSKNSVVVNINTELGSLSNISFFFNSIPYYIPFKVI